MFCLSRIFRKFLALKVRKKKNLDDLLGAIKEGENFNAVEDKHRIY